jgi:hypothetical protein
LNQICRDILFIDLEAAFIHCEDRIDDECIPAITGQDSHQCAADLYDGWYRLTLSPVVFHIRYVVKGPNKDYISTTTFNVLENI